LPKYKELGGIKMRKSLLIVIVLLCVATLMASMAYNTATISNAAELKISNTNVALLALSPLGGIGNLDQTSYVEDGNLVFEFGRGNNPWFGGDMNYGLQKNSTYEWWNGGASNTGLFAIQNRSAEKIELYIKIKDIPAGVTIKTNQSMGDGGNGWQTANGTWKKLPRVLASGSTCDIGFKIIIDDTAVLGLYGMEVMVKAVAIP
jgi:hypothetical protein